MTAPGPDPTPEEQIREAILDHGPITFAEFMEIALYGPGGFYEHPPVGRHGHFVTSPHVHPVFGELLAEALRQLHVALGRHAPLTVVEVGAGDGTLARQIVEHIGEGSVDYLAVERSPGAREALATLPVRVSAGLAPRLDRGVVLANELLDNLPFRRVRMTHAGLREVTVSIGGDELIEVEGPSDEELTSLAPPLRDGEEATIPTGALSFVDEVAGVLRCGFALLIDYGSPSWREAGEVHGYRDHQVVERVLRSPGSADVTAGVDFGAVVRRANERSLITWGPVTQQAALTALGLGEWLERERERQVSLLDQGAGLDAVRAWGSRSRATLLADPAGLGRLRWLLLATAGLPQPRWMGDALGPEGG